MGKKTALTLSMILLFASVSIHAQVQEELNFPITQYKLKNGLQVILSEDYTLPLVSVVVAYKVGSIHEKPGKAGLAYLLDNLMFQGSQNIGRMQHISFIQRTGGNLNAVTTEDRTLFYQTVPSNQLALVLWLESDRMKSLEINASNVERTKEALIEEIRQRKSNDPYLESFLFFDRLLFLDFAHSHPVFGSEANIRNMEVEDVEDFYNTYYRPNNAVLSITGNINKRKVIQLVRKYFESIPEGNEIDPPPIVRASENKSVVETYQESLASLPGYYLGYRIAPPHSNDFYPLKIIEFILLRGNSSRLYKKLIKQDRTAIELSGGIEEKRELAVFKIFVLNNNKIMRERSRKTVLSEINKLKFNFISEKELRKAKNIFRMDYINQIDTYQDRAISLAEAYLDKKNIGDFPGELEKYLAVTASKITGIMNRYFTKNNILLNVEIR